MSAEGLTLGKASLDEIAQGRGTKDDFDKVPVSMVPPEALLEIAKVFHFGAVKYARDNYRLGMSWSRMQDAATRHWLAWQQGEDHDPQSGLHHLAHAGCCTMMALTYVLDPARHGGNDDRYKQGELNI